MSGLAFDYWLISYLSGQPGQTENLSGLPSNADSISFVQCTDRKLCYSDGVKKVEERSWVLVMPLLAKRIRYYNLLSLLGLSLRF